MYIYIYIYIYKNSGSIAVLIWFNSRGSNALDWDHSNIMVCYAVYMVTYRTRLQTLRSYVGMTGDADVRQKWHRI